MERSHRGEGDSSKQFVQEVSMHAVRHVYSTVLWRRIFWNLMIVGLIVYLVIACSGFVIGFANRIVSTKVTYVDAPELTLPTVTICSRNMIMKSKLDKEADADAIVSLLDILYPSSIGYAVPIDWQDPKFNTPFFKNSTVASEKLAQLAATISESTFVCYLRRVAMNCSDILTLVRTEIGICFQFNGNGSIKTTFSGVDEGIYIGLTAHADDYMSGPNSMAEGFLYTLGSADIVPMVNQLAHYLSPNVAANVLVKATEISRQPPPADRGNANCFNVNKDRNPLFYYPTYSYSGCFTECTTKHIIERCGCRTFYHPPVDGVEIRSMEAMATCVDNAIKIFRGDPDILTRCDCRKTCHEILYEGTLSFSKFPSFFTSQRMSKYMNMTTEDIASNMAILNVYYGELSYLYIKEDISYSGFDMIANLGGTLGVCLGASLVTIIEIMECGIISLCTWLFHRNKKTTPEKLALEKGSIGSAGQLDQIFNNLESVMQMFGMGGDGCGMVCEKGETLVQRADYKYTPSGCGTFGAEMQLEVIPLMQDCCNQHGYCYEQCGQNKTVCDSQLRKCSHQMCVKASQTDTEPTDKESMEACQTVGDLLYQMTSMLGCKPFLKSQEKACECIKVEEDKDEL